MMVDPSRERGKREEHYREMAPRRRDARPAVRALMEERGERALVVRAPTMLSPHDFWSMKGYDACVVPREGEPVLICSRGSRRRDEAAPPGSQDVRYVRG